MCAVLNPDHLYAQGGDVDVIRAMAAEKVGLTILENRPKNVVINQNTHLGLTVSGAWQTIGDIESALSTETWPDGTKVWFSVINEINTILEVSPSIAPLKLPKSV